MDYLKKKNKDGYELVNRDDYIELCSPIAIDYELCNYMYNNHIDEKDCEIIPFLDTFKVKCNLIEGNYKNLRKITTIEDI